MKILLTGAAMAAMILAPSTANAQFFGGSNNSGLNTLAGAGAGAGIGALIAGRGNNVEGALLGAALGGVASNAFAPQQGFGGFGNSSTGSTLVGAGAGAGIGALIAGRGNNVEGALLGAALGGVAGNAFGPRRQSFNGRPAGRYVGGPVQGGFPVQQGPVYSQAPVGYINSGQYVSGPVVPVTRYVQPQVQPIYTHRTVYVQQPAPAPVVQRVVVRAPQIAQCPANTTPQSDGTCLDRNVTQYVSPVEQRSTSSRHEPCPSGSTKQADGTCLTSMVTHIDHTVHSQPSYTAAPQPSYVQAQPYQPQSVYCYEGSSQRYDQWGHNLSKGHGNSCHN